MHEPPHPIDYRVLGPVRAVQEGEPLRLGGRRQQALLALLLAANGRSVSADRLAEDLWAGEPPTGADVTLPTYVSRLRAALGDRAEIAGGAAGYAMAVEPEQIDAVRFERLLRESEAAMARGTPQPALERLREALALWRGRPFGGLGEDGTLRVEAERLEEQRLHAIEMRFEAELAVGQAPEIVADLETLVDEHPYRERLWWLLMLALYRADRQADALAAYGRARHLLDEQLGLAPGEELERLQMAILRHDVPTVTPAQERHNLPAPLTSFVGRERELADVERRLRDGRLVTLTGVGGVGKTRLALELARRAVTELPDGVVFVDLSSVADPPLVAAQVAVALEIREQSGLSAIDQFRSRLRNTELLLVLDNCEHVRDRAAELTAFLLAAAPRLRILATSREVLGVPGEATYLVPPLALPSDPEDPDAIRASDAVALFLARARDARPGLIENAENLATAAAICSNLDGLPLAIELAAARSRALSLTEIAVRLRDRYQFLVSPRRLANARHRTLREAMNWSYELLTPDERVLLAQLSVFVGSFSLDAVAAVCLAGDDAAALGCIERLVDASLIAPGETGGATRYRLLETVRQYAAEQLEANSDIGALRERHATYFGALAERAWVPIRLEGGEWIARLAADQDNLRAALAWKQSAGPNDQFLRLAEALWWFWSVHGDLSEGRAWLDSALDGSSGVDPSLRSRALLGASSLAWFQGDVDRAYQLAEEAGDIITSLDAIATPAGDEPAARFEGGVWEIMGLVALVRGDHAAAAELLERFRDAIKRLPDGNLWRQENLAVAGIDIGQAALARGEPDVAEREFIGARATWDELATDAGVALADANLAFVAIEREQYGVAATTLGRVLRAFRDVDHIQFIVDCLDAVAAVVLAGGQAEHAVQCLSAASRLRVQTGYRSFGWLARLPERVLDRARQEIGQVAFDAAWTTGQVLSMAEAIELALRSNEPLAQGGAISRRSIA